MKKPILAAIMGATFFAGTIFTAFSIADAENGGNNAWARLVARVTSLEDRVTILEEKIDGNSPNIIVGTDKETYHLGETVFVTAQIKQVDKDEEILEIVTLDADFFRSASALINVDTSKDSFQAGFGFTLDSGQRLGEWTVIAEYAGEKSENHFEVIE